MQVSRKMNQTSLLVLAIVSVSIGLCQAQWSACSRTCGWGTKHRTCTTADYPPCLVRYDDCKLRDCPSVTCISPNVFKRDSASECCKKADPNSCGVVQLQAIARRVIGGTKSDEGEWPWMAALWQKSPKLYFCGGALVNEKWVITAAHCFEDNRFAANDVMVMLGTNKQSGPHRHVQTSNVKDYIKYSEIFNGWNDDIALLKLETPMRYSSHVHPICMPNSEQPDQDTICYAAGWGFATFTDVQRKRTSNDLFHVGLRIVPLDACKQTYRNQDSSVGVTDKTLCVGIFAGGKDTCNGDSGSPLVCQRKSSCQWYFAGIVSFGLKDCAAKYSPAVYTNVKVYETWILNRMHPCQDEKPCKNGGVCVKQGMNYKCNCKNGYTGVHCDGRWSEWQPCSKSCGGGTRFKVDRCPLNEYTSCPKTYGDCNTQSCNALSACPVGYRFRYEDPSSCCKVVNEKCGIDVGAKPRSRRVIGGTKATQGEMPWVFQVAFLRRRDKLIHCGGALLNKQWVATAGHCFEYPSDVYVLLGSVTTTNPASGHETREVAEYKVHPQYSFPANDIALVKLNKNVKYSDGIKPICLPTSEITPVDKTCVLGGWGYTKWYDLKSWKNHLHQVKVRTLPLDACIEGYKRDSETIWRELDNTQHMCAGILSGGKGGCAGDGGAPLLCQRCSTCGWYLAGISSFGARECGKAGVPDTYTNVYNYQNWIRQQISLSTTENFVC